MSQGRGVKWLLLLLIMGWLVGLGPNQTRLQPHPHLCTLAKRQKGLFVYLQISLAPRDAGQLLLDNTLDHVFWQVTLVVWSCCCGHGFAVQL